MAARKSKQVGDDDKTWPGMDTLLEMLGDIQAVGRRTEAGVNMLSKRCDEIEAMVAQNGQQIKLAQQGMNGVMELGGSVLDAKAQVEKSLAGVKSQLHKLIKAQQRTYDLIAAHARQPAQLAHAATKTRR